MKKQDAPPTRELWQNVGYYIYIGILVNDETKQQSMSAYQQSKSLGYYPDQFNPRLTRRGYDSSQSRIMCRLRIKRFLLESWVDCNRKMGKHFESWVNVNQNPGNQLESWVDSEKIPGKPLDSWVESIQVFEILLESCADSNQGTWVICPKRSTKFSKSPK